MRTVRINPKGVYEIGVAEDADGQTYCQVQLPDPRSGTTVELVFMLPEFVTFADWVSMAATELLGERKRGLGENWYDKSAR